jgi:shikimate dehydrogenase
VPPNTRDSDTPMIFYFIGVTTSQSSIMRIFPRWMADLGRAVQIVGVDLPIHAPHERYRAVVEAIKHDPLALGALVTTHKIDLLAAARDLFDALDPYAELCGEVSSISKRDAALVGRALDPITAGIALQELLGQGYWARSGGQALCMGAGGAGIAISVYLLSHRDDRPAKLIVTDRDQARLDGLRAIHVRLGGRMPVEYIHTHDPRAHDALLARLPEGSLAINATGMGKDIPGSPISDAGQFPRGGVVWELNYRGDRPFLRQAQAQAPARGLTVADGWRYFLYGWTKVIEEVLHVELSDEQFQRWDVIAASARG